MVEVKKALPKVIQWAECVADDIEKHNTILDSRIPFLGGYIVIPTSIRFRRCTLEAGFRFPVPKIVGITSVIDVAGNKVSYLNSLQKAYNSLVRAVETYKVRPTRGVKRWLRNVIDKVRRELQAYISGRSGMIRNTLYSIPLKYSGRAVVTPHDDEPNVAYIPRRVAERWVRNPEFRKTFGVEHVSDLEGQRVIVGRQPTHRYVNMLSFVLKLTDYDVVKIHPIVITLMDGDYDGDTVWFAMIGDIPDLHVEKAIQHYEPDKEFKVLFEGLEVTYENASKVAKLARDYAGGFDPLDPDSHIAYDPSGYENGQSIEEFLEADAAMAYKVMKQDVARAGGLSGLIVNLAVSTGKPEHVFHATFVRHDITQVPLDCKHGIKNYNRSLINMMEHQAYRVVPRDHRIFGTYSDEQRKAWLREFFRHMNGKSLRNELDRRAHHWFAARRSGLVTRPREIMEVIRKWSYGE